MAYTLGLWWADGCICGKIFSISLHEKDKYVLEKILSKMNSNCKLRKTGNNFVIEICSPTLVKDISALGGCERKSKVCMMPKVPKEFLSDFIRGYWDGDGTVHIHNKKHYISGCISGSEKFIYGLASALQENIKRTLPKIRTEKSKNGSVYYRIEMGHNDTRRLRDFMYNSSELKMERKYNLFCMAGEITRDFRDAEYLSYEDAIKVVRELNIKTQSEWYSLIKNKENRPSGIPLSPYSYYKNKGWISWYDFLGKTKKVPTHNRNTNDI